MIRSVLAIMRAAHSSAHPCLRLFLVKNANAYKYEYFYSLAVYLVRHDGHHAGSNFIVVCSWYC